LTRRNLLRSWLAAALSIVAVLAVGLFTVRPGVVGAAQPRYFRIAVSDAGFNPPIVQDVNVGDVLIFQLDSQADEEHTVTFDDPSLCPGSSGGEPCWPELRFDKVLPGQRCERTDGFIIPRWRCMIVREPGKTVRYTDTFNKANGGEIRVLGQPTTTTGPSTTTTTRPPTTTTTAPTTTTTLSQSTTTTAPTQIRPFVIPDPTTSTSAPPVPVVVTTDGGTPAPTANKDKDKDKSKGKAAGTETPTTASPVPPDTMPPDSVFDAAALTPGPVLVPETPGDPASGDDVNIESSAVMNLLDREEAADHRPLLLAFGALAFLLLVGGLWHWFHRASAYDPA